MGFDRTAIGFAEDAGPVPLLKQHIGIGRLKLAPEVYKQRCQRYELCVVGDVPLLEYELSMQKLGGLSKSILNFVCPGVVLVEIEVEDVALLTSDTRSLVSGRAFLYLPSAPLLSCYKCDGLQELFPLDAAKDAKLLAYALPPRVPIIAKREIVCSEGRGYELEHREGNPTGIDFLEDGAYSLLGSLLAEFNDRELIFVESTDYGLIEPFPKRYYVVARVLTASTLPIAKVGQQPTRWIE